MLLQPLGQLFRVPGPVLAGRGTAVARPVAGARVLDPEVGVDPGRTRVDPRGRPGSPARRIAPLRSVGPGIRAIAVTAGVDDGAHAAAERRLEPLAPGNHGGRPLEVRHVRRESAAVPEAGPD